MHRGRSRRAALVAAVLWFVLIHAGPVALTVYGIWLGLQAKVIWGLALIALFPLAYVAGWTEVVGGVSWPSPLWPFAWAGLWYLAGFALHHFVVSHFLDWLSDPRPDESA